MAGSESASSGFGILGDPKSWFNQQLTGAKQWGNQAVNAGRAAVADVSNSARDLWATTVNAVAQGAKMARDYYDANPPDAAHSIEDRFLAGRMGNILGVGRGVVHSVEGLGQTADFVGRFMNPLDQLLSPPGQSAFDQAIGRAELANRVVARAFSDPASVIEIAKKGLHQARIDLDPNATPAAAKPSDELGRQLRIGENQGELGYSLGSFLIGDGLLNLSPVYKMTTAAEFKANGLSPGLAAYFAKPYKGMGHHVFPRAGINLFGVNIKLPKPLLDSSFNVLKPEGMNRGDFYGLHYSVDPSAKGFRLPDQFGGGWSGAGAGLDKYNAFGRFWYGTPPPLKQATGLFSLGLSAGDAEHSLEGDGE